MKCKLKIEKDFDIKYIEADFGVRYFEDAELNGIEDDNENPKMPCIIKKQNENRWKILVDIEKGRINNWETGNTAKIHYKVCDDGIYSLLDEHGGYIKKIESYVPAIFAINDEGFGDYVIMNIDEDGFIENWECTPEDIQDMIAKDFNNF